MKKYIRRGKHPKFYKCFKVTTNKMSNVKFEFDYDTRQKIVGLSIVSN